MWSGIPISKNFPQFVVIRTVKGFCVVNEADVFLEFPYFLYDPTAAAKSLQSCPTQCDPETTAVHQAPLFLGFFRQEHWSGLPFPSPMHESEK